jgi:nitrate reductase gamma subunit
MTTDLLFRILPGAAAALCAIGLLARTGLAPAPAAALARPQSPRRSGRQRLWRASLLLLFIGHLMAVVAPRVIVRWNGSPARLYLLESIGLVVGIVALAGCLRVLWRHFARADAHLGRTIADSVLGACALLAIASGVLTAVRFRWASSWATGTLTPYLLSLVRGDADTALVARLPPLVKLHVVTTFGALAVFPFTSVAAPVVAALQRPLTALLAAGAAVARLPRALARRGDLARRLWPDEDYAGPLPAATAIQPEPGAGLLDTELDAARLRPDVKAP